MFGKQFRYKIYKTVIFHYLLYRIDESIIQDQYNKKYIFIKKNYNTNNLNE